MQQANPDALTDRRKSILTFIVDYKDEHDYAPTLAEIEEHEGITARAIHRHLGVLEGAGYIQRQPNKARAISVLRVPESIQRPEEGS